MSSKPRKLVHEPMRVLFISLLLMMPWTSLQAEAFEEAGIITEIGLKGFFIDGEKHRLSPGAKLINPSGERRQLKDLKSGDLILGQGTVISGVRYIEVVTYFPMEPN